ncbi:unnamed protein product [Prorocentrum cordatum]|uniref:Peptidylamidoglycolate lyase n=1 Tax=Prorocentrum cordatum TaxID=2364126 RepID=A0ABN9YBN8_9DINO|nr:unnamed protein product [Polarella glacialis]
MPTVPSALPVPLVAGTLGLFGCSGEESPATLSRWRLPRALSLDSAGQVLYVSDAGNHAVRRVDLRTGRVATFAGTLGRQGAMGDGGQATAALLREPHGLALDNASRRLFVADRGNSGRAASAQLRYPAGLAMDQASERLFVADLGNSVVRALDLRSGVLWGLVAAQAVELWQPAGLAVDSQGQVLYVADSGQHVVLALNLSEAPADENASGLADQNTSGLSNESGENASGLPDENASGLSNESGENASGLPDESASDLPNGTATAGDGFRAAPVVLSSAVVLGTPGRAGGRGDAATAFRGEVGSGLQVYLKGPSDLAVDSVAQRLYVADAANPAVLVLDLASGVVATAVARPGYYGHGLSDEDAGDSGLALSEPAVPGTPIIFTTTHPPEGGADWVGKYFYLRAFGHCRPPQRGPPDFAGHTAAPAFTEGVYQALHFRRGVLHWVGFVQLYNTSYRISEVPIFCHSCTAAGYRVSSPEEGQWEVGDVVMFPALHEQPATQVLYMAEGHNFVVRAADLAVPPEPLCAG